MRRCSSETRFELSVLYYSALSACSSALVTLEDDETETEYITHKLYSALYDMTDFLICRVGEVAPALLSQRVGRVREIYGDSYGVPVACKRLLHRDLCLSRYELESICCSLDWWFTTKCSVFREECDSGQHIHSFVG